MASAALARARHDQIWKAQGPCTAGCGSGRDLICEHCHEPFCAKCLRVHKGKDHARLLYLLKVRDGKITGYTPEEYNESLALP